MGRASSSKKVARVARAGGRGARTGPRRNLGFPAIITLIVVLGVSLLVFAKLSQDDAEASPSLSDHWHAAYGVFVCDEFIPPFDGQDDPVGIHSHADGVIHIHPFDAAVAGEDATLGVFFETMDGELADEAIRLPDGSAVTEGEDDCAGEDAVVQVARWEHADQLGTGPEVRVEDVAAVRFENDFEAYTIAFAPEGSELPPPPTIPMLDQLTDVTGAG